MASSATDGRLRFPSKDAITSYLETHRLTNSLYNQQKKINETVAEFFASSTVLPEGVQTGVMLTMLDLNETSLCLPTSAILVLSISLSQALQDCAKANAIELAKDDSKSKV